MNPDQPDIPKTQSECVELSRKVLACLDKLASASANDERDDALRLAACQLQLVIDLLDGPQSAQS